MAYARDIFREDGHTMSEEYGADFVTVTDEDGNEIVLEFIDALEHNGQMYQAFFPAEVEGEEVGSEEVFFVKALE